MLEQDVLLVEKPKSIANGKPDGERTAEIRHWPSQQQLGFAAWKIDRPKSWWRSPRWSVHVFENEDACHLMTIHPPRMFFGGWEVRDAIKRSIGVVYPASVIDKTGDFIARMESNGRNGDGAFVDWEQREVGLLESDETHQTVLHFSDMLDGLPFPRMLLLAAVLIRQSD